MKLLGWNCRGMNSPEAVRALMDLQGQVKADVLFLSESHLKKDKAESLRRRLGFNFLQTVESDGRAGGLVLFWNSDNKILLQYMTPNYIDVVFDCGGQDNWRLTCFYGEPNWENRHWTWDCLRDLHARARLPWMVFGDFNEILYSHEKDGGNPRPLRMMQNFHDCIAECDLADLGFSGDVFTWRR